MLGRDMTEPNTLFILAKWGLKVVDGVYETHMWILTEQEASMKYVSLHKSKADRAGKGGEIVKIRLATERAGNRVLHSTEYFPLRLLTRRCGGRIQARVVLLGVHQRIPGFNVQRGGR